MSHLINRFFQMLSIVALTVLPTACSSDGPDDPGAGGNDVTITVNPDVINVGSEASQSVLNVKASADWSISSDADWCKIFPSGGLKNTATNITVTIDGNRTVATREATLSIVSGSTLKRVPVRQIAPESVVLSAETVCFGAQQSTASITLTANTGWTLSQPSDASWLTVTPTRGEAGTLEISLNCSANDGQSDRQTELSFAAGSAISKLKVIQYNDFINTPQGYTLVWNDEFNTADGTQPDLSKWYYDEWAAGFVNNELQRYVVGGLGAQKTAEIKGGVLNITAQKYGDQVISARLNTRQLWQYGYFEARLKLPKGKGTWPAFWMMPADGNNWPHCGEIDIMEEVGTNPNYTSSSIHCTSYNHTIGTQKTAERYTAGAEDQFHVYALEWTPDYIRTYVDGVQLFNFANDKKGDENTWPFDKPFHPILNLAWGGSWGGMNGVDENALPATYEIDYVRIFQKL